MKIHSVTLVHVPPKPGTDEEPGHDGGIAAEILGRSPLFDETGKEVSHTNHRRVIDCDKEPADDEDPWVAKVLAAAR